MSVPAVKGEKEGWLVKKKQKRYFVLSQGTLTWLTHPLGDIKGSLELRNYTASRTSAGDGISLQPVSKAAKLKEYVLTSKVAGDVDSWLAAFDHAIKSSFLRKAPSFVTSTTAAMKGWLEKKGKKRWFALSSEVLFWFDKPQLADADMKRNQNNSLDLLQCTVARGPDARQPRHSTSFNLTLTNTTTDKQYVLTAKDETELKAWLAALTAALAIAQQRTQQLQEQVQDARDMVKRGILLKKGQKRFFVLKDCVLTWYLNEQEDKARGSTILRGCSVVPSPSKLAFTIRIPNGEEYELTASLKRDYEEWVAMVTKACQFQRGSGSMGELLRTNMSPKAGSRGSMSLQPQDKHGWLMKKGKRRYFFHHNNLLMYFVEEQGKHPDFSAIQGTITLNGCTVEKNFHEFSFTIRTPVGKAYTLTARSAAEADEWVQVLEIALAMDWTDGLDPSRLSEVETVESAAFTKRGYMKKKGSDRFFVLHEDVLKWYESDKPGTKPKGSTVLGGSSVYSLDPVSFMLATPSGDRYPLTTASEHEKTSWMQALQEGSAFAADFQKRGWLGKKNKRRWFALQNGMLLWFDHQQALQDTTPAQANGSVTLVGSKAFIKVQQSDPCAFTIENVAEKKEGYALKAPSPKDAEAWVRALNQAKMPRSAAGKVFGVAVSRLPADDAGIPVVYAKLMSLIEARGLGLEGIFRLSASTERLTSIRNEIESAGSIATFRDGDEECHAAAVLLKTLFRELPEPITTYELYDKFLAATTPEQARDIWQTLPDANRRVFAHLLRFLHKVSEHSSVNHMTCSNLAVVFGPNLFARKVEGDISPFASLAESPQIMRAVKMMIENSQTMFL